MRETITRNVRAAMEMAGYMNFIMIQFHGAHVRTVAQKVRDRNFLKNLIFSLKYV
ncbi:MAG: hypothetical protein ACM31J_07415 [Nitrososphaerales archaeon]